MKALPPVRVLELNPACFCAQVESSSGWITLRRMTTRARAEGYLDGPEWVDSPREGIQYAIDYPGREKG